jgi:antirestriction protein ArdC
MAADTQILRSFAGPDLGVAVDFDNQASFINNWQGVLRKEKKAIFRAAAEAQRAADYILGLHPDDAAADALPDSSDGENGVEYPNDDALAGAASLWRRVQPAA